VGASADYLALVGRCFLISAVARVYQPGCQSDYMLVLEGDQGLYKTSLFRTLFEPWFTDDVPPLHNKDASIALLGKWCVLLDEMETWSKADHGVAKQFISRRVEDFRLPYDKFNSAVPRQCVFTGTLNPIDGFLSDPTGNRRYWVVTISGKISIEKIKQVKDQLWAETYHRYRAGEKWWFDDKIAKPYQEARFREDPWTPKVEAFVNLVAKSNREELVAPDISTIATSGLEIPIGKCGTSERNRIAAILRRSGFESKVRKVETRNARCWVKALPKTLDSFFQSPDASNVITPAWHKKASGII
jgi:predicted P-loop ATPase